MRIRHLSLAVGALLLASTPALAAVRTVGPAGPPTYDFAEIQQAIDASSNGDYIYVAPGTYTEWLRFWGKILSVRSTGGPEVTTIDGSGETNAFAVVNFIDGEISKTVLDGFTITGGHGDGGGVDIIGSEPSLLNLIIVDNDVTGGQGSAIYCNQCGSDMDRLQIADNSGGDAPVYIDNYADVSITNALITGNMGNAAVIQNGWSDSAFDHVTITANSTSTAISVHHADVFVSNSIVWPGGFSLGC